MKRLTKCLLTTMVLVLMFGMTSQAAVKKVAITQPTKKASYTVYRSKKNVSKKIKATVSTTSKKDSKKLTYKSSNPEVVSVTSSGKLTCKKAGKATITVASKQDPKKKDTIKITVVQRATGLTATTSGYEIKNKKTLTLTKGKNVTVKITAAPEGASNKVTWKTSDKKVATVKNGKISAKATGTATITATAKDGSKKKISFKVKVVTGKVTSVSVDKADVALVVGGTAEEAKATVTATVKTSGKKASKAIGWTSADEKVATVKNGVITAVAPGKTTVTVTAVDGSKKKAVVAVTVTRKPEPQPEQKPESGSGDQGTGSGDQGTGSGDQGTGSGDQGTGTGDQGTGSDDQGPGSDDQGPGSDDQGPTVYTKVLTVKKDAFTNGFAVTGQNSVDWDYPQKALNALNTATKNHEIIAPSRVFSGVNVVANGKDYTLKYDKVDGYTLKAVTNPDEDIILELLDGKLVSDVTIGNTVTEKEVDRYLAKLGVGKAAFENERYDFGSGTVTVNGKKYIVKDVAIVDEDVVATVNGEEIKAVLSRDGMTVTVTSDKPLDSNMEAVEALFGGAYTEQ